MQMQLFDAITRDKTVDTICLRIVLEENGQTAYCWPWHRETGLYDGERPEVWAEEDVSLSIDSVTLDEYRALRRYRRQAARERRAARRKA